MRSSHLRIEDVMTRTPVAVAPEELLATAAHQMLIHRVRHLPVCEAGRIVGVVSQRDIYYAQAHSDETREVVRVTDAMTPFPYVVAKEKLVEEVAMDLADAKYGAAVVLEGDHPIGVFTTTDGMRLLAELLSERTRAAEGEAARGSRATRAADVEPTRGER